MIIKKLTSNFWKFEVNGIILIGTYEECTQKLEVYARMWGI